MTNNNYTIVADVIKNRRSVGGPKMNGQKIPDDTVKELLELAHWAPTHGRTEPWQFHVYTGEALLQFGLDHGNLYWNNTPEETRMQGTKEKLENNIKSVSHLVVSVMKRGANEKIPQLEEIAATSAAVQNILLGATALGIASFWSTGGMTLKPAMKQYLGLGNDDVVLGLIYLGYTDEPAKPGVRNTHHSEKVIWK
jgi:nitroreductase